MKANRTEIIYDIYSFLFREPQHLGKIRNPKSPYNTYEKSMNHLKQMEVTLNHLMNVFFCFLPSNLLHSFFEKSLGKPIWTDEYEVFVRDLGEVVPSIGDFTQPDIFFVGSKNNIAIEMKINAKSSLEQVMKYALLHYLEYETSKIKKSYSLIYLGKWNFESLREKWYKTIEELKDGFSQYQISDKSKKWSINLSKYHSAIKEMVKTMTISYISYNDIKDFCIETLPQVKSNFQVEKLLMWMVEELEMRKLV